jgi:hypothetical protein
VHAATVLRTATILKRNLATVGHPAPSQCTMCLSHDTRDGPSYVGLTTFLHFSDGSRHRTHIAKSGPVCETWSREKRADRRCLARRYRDVRRT